MIVNVLNIKPVVPTGLTENWNLINRTIMPVVYQDSGFMGQTVIGEATLGQRGLGTNAFTTQEQDLGSQFGLGDIPTRAFSPRQMVLGSWSTT